MNRFNPKFMITNRITAGLTRIERARGFLEAATLTESTFHLAEHLAYEWTQWLSRHFIRVLRSRLEEALSDTPVVVVPKLADSLAGRMEIPYRREKVEDAGRRFDQVVSRIQARDFAVTRVPEAKVCKECDLKALCSAEGVLRNP
ncbi:MAG: hypothetical protein ABIJ53_00465 [Verrucomicrobiota bacterium]